MRKPAEPAEKAPETGQNSGSYPGGIIAKLLNITERRLQQLAKEGVIPRSGRDSYPLAGAVRGYIRFLQQTTPGADRPIDPEKLAPFQRKAHYQAEAEKLKLAAEAGSVIARGEVESAMARVAKVVTAFLDTLPDILERDTGATPQQLAKLEELLDKMRVAMYAELIKEPEPAGKRATG